MSKARRNSLGDLPSQRRQARDIPFVSQETRAATDLNRQWFHNDPTDQHQPARTGDPPPGPLSYTSERQENHLTPKEWEEKNLLTFDGGGIRGYASIIMIEALMKCIGQIERRHREPHDTSFFPYHKPNALVDDDEEGAWASDFLPCHYFDYIIGTSTGGLIAVMLSRWRMSVRECRNKYETLGRDVFGHRRPFSFMGIPYDKHHKEPLIKAIKDLTNLKTPSQSGVADSRFEMFSAPGDLCRTAVFANEETGHRRTKGPYIFRSYNIDANEDPSKYCHLLNPTASINHPIWEVCRATTAAPTFFRPQNIDGKQYSDGALGTNNPTEKGIDEIYSIYNKYPRFVVSFGTGKPTRDSKRREHAKKKFRIGEALDLVNELLHTARAGLTDCEKTHEGVEKHAERDKVFDYTRFNIEEGLGKMKIDECQPETYETLRRCAKSELEKVEVKNKLQRLAQALVAQRRDRIRKHKDHWERFACCTRYECKAESCYAEGRERFSCLTKNQMRDHLRTQHPSPEAVEGMLDLCRRQPEFPVGPL